MIMECLGETLRREMDAAGIVHSRCGHYAGKKLPLRFKGILCNNTHTERGSSKVFQGQMSVNRGKGERCSPRYQRNQTYIRLTESSSYRTFLLHPEPNINSYRLSTTYPLR